MKKITKFSILASALFLIGACAEANVEEVAVDAATAGEGVEMTFSISLAEESADTRIDVADDWSLTWTAPANGNYDDLSVYSSAFDAWGMAWFGEVSDDLKYATFSYTSYAQDEDNLRLFYPYSSSMSSTIDLTQQESGLSALYMVSETMYSTSITTDMDIMMKHVGAAVALNVNFSNNMGDYTLKSFVVEGLNSGATVDVAEDYDSADFYTEVTSEAITVTMAEELSATDSTTAEIRFNIMPSTIAPNAEVTITYTLEDAAGNVVSYTDTVANTGKSAVEFARATYNTINSTCELAVTAFTYEVTPSSSNAEIVFNIDTALCDGIAISTDCMDMNSYNEYTSYILSDLADGYDSSYLQFATDSTPITASSKALAAEDDYFVQVVAYTVDADGNLTAVGDVVDIFFTTTAKSDADFADITLDISVSSTSTSTIGIDVVRADGVDSYYYGCVETASVDSEYDGDLQAWITANFYTYGKTQSISSVSVGGTYTQSISRVTALPTASSSWGATLTDGTEYYIFVIPIEASTSNEGYMSYVKASTDEIAVVVVPDDATLEVDIISYQLNSNGFSFTFSSEYCTEIYAQAFTYDASSGIESDFASSAYYALSDNGDGTFTRTYTNSFGFNSSNTFYLYYKGFSDSTKTNGSELYTLVFVPSEYGASSDGDDDDSADSDDDLGVYTSDATVTGFEMDWANSTVAWANDPAEYGYTFPSNNADMTFAGTFSGTAAKYVYCCVLKEKVSVAASENIAENLTAAEVRKYADFAVSYILTYSGYETVDGSFTGFYFNSYDRYLLVIPVDEAGVYGQPAVYDIDWDYIETNQFGTYSN